MAMEGYLDSWEHAPIRETISPRRKRDAMSVGKKKRGQAAKKCHGNEEKGWKKQ